MASRSVLVAALLLALVMVAAEAGVSARVHKFWEINLPGVVMPCSLRDAVSPIEGTAVASQFALHIEHGTFYPATSASFCKTAGLVCHEAPIATELDSGDFNYKAAGQKSTSRGRLSKGYFLWTDLKNGASMRLREQPRRAARSFLPTIVADALPPLTSRHSFTKLQHLFYLRKGTGPYAAVKFALEVCRVDSTLPGEARVCPTSIDSLITFVSSHLDASDLRILKGSSRPRGVTGPMKVERYSVQDGQTVVCHVVDFPSRLYMCHFVPDTKVVEAILSDSSGAVTRAVGCCHLDTKAWNPEHQSFKMLGVAPGTPVCHWSADDTLVFVSKSSKSNRQSSGHGDGYTAS